MVRVAVPRSISGIDGLAHSSANPAAPQRAFHRHVEHGCQFAMLALPAPRRAYRRRRFAVRFAPMGAEKPDEELMLAYAQGDVRAFDALYQRQRGMLYRFILRSVPDRASADELFQETW